MGLFDKIRGEFVDIIEWLDNSNDTIAYRFERFQNEIKMGAKLTVRPGQRAVFVNEGQIADIFDPGLFQLSTQNLPLLSTLQGWKYGFNSPFKAEVYFFNTRIFTNLKWGTANPIMVRDPELGPVRLRAFGSYSIRVVDPRALLEELISTDGLFQVDEISDQIRNMIMTSFANNLGSNRIPLLDLASNYGSLGNTIRTTMQPDVQRFGLDLAQLLIENISLPLDVETALDKRASMGILGNMQQYAQFQAANAIEASAKTPNGSPGLDFGVGIAMGQQMMNTFAQPQQATVQTVPPPPVQTAVWYLSRNGQNFGPFEPAQMIQQGMTAETFVWRSGLPGWLRSREVPEMALILGTVPPPPPS